MSFAAATFLFIFLIHLLIETRVEQLNLSTLGQGLPLEFQDEFEGVYSEEKYRQSQCYLREQTRFGLVGAWFSAATFLLFWWSGGFGMMDEWVRGFHLGSIVTGLLFVGVLVGIKQVLGIPFSIYQTFVLEERFGFNKTTVKTFIMDRIKGLVLGILLGGLLLYGVLWFFETLGKDAWIYAWGFVVLLQLVMMWLAPLVLLPLFYKLTPLPEGELRRAVEDFARLRKFPLGGIYTMDGSRRSTKTNAFFTGFGQFKKIVLFDTLISKHTIEELVGILAHEIGHYQRKHIFKFIVMSILSTGVGFFILSLFLNHPLLFEVFKVRSVSVYGSLVFLNFFYGLISQWIHLGTNYLSRKFEFEADRFAVETFGHSDALISALKKLSAENLSHLTPHPWKVRWDYSHPPVLERIRALKALSPGPDSVA